MLKKRFNAAAKKAHKLTLEEEENDQMDFDSLDDEQYFQLLQGNLPKSHKQDLDLGAKYQGKQIDATGLDESIDSDEIPDYQDSNTPRQPEQPIKQPRNKTRMPFNLKSLEEDDLEIVERKKQDLQELQKVSQQINEQLQIWGSLVEIRQQLQKSLELVKKLPINNRPFLNKQSKDSSFNDLIVQVQTNVNNLRDLYHSLYPCEALQRVDILSRGFNSQLISEFSQGFESNRQAIEDDIIKWSSKAALLSTMQNKQMNFLLLTPVGQAQKAMQLKDRLLQKCQLKRSIFRILGEEPSDLKENSSKHIFDDTDFYLDLLKESISNKNQGEDAADDQLLLKRQLQRQERLEKSVDRRASKCRKIRYEPHQKLINFMAREEPKESLLSRDEIIRNLFGKAKKLKSHQTENIDISLI